jgi:hypothetical protein
MYANSNKASSDSSKIASYNSSNPTTVKTYIVNTLGYTRLCNGNIDEIPPVVAVDPALSTVVLTLNFSLLLSATEPTLSVSGDLVKEESPVYRGIPDTAISSSQGKKFSVMSMTSTDADFDLTDRDSTSSYFYVQICAFTYGLDDSFNPIYSTAKILSPVLVLTYPSL